MIEKISTLLVRLAIVAIFWGQGVLIAKCLNKTHVLKQQVSSQNTDTYDCFVQRSADSSFDANNRCRGCGCPRDSHDDH